MVLWDVMPCLTVAHTTSYRVTVDWLLRCLKNLTTVHVGGNRDASSLPSYFYLFVSFSILILGTVHLCTDGFKPRFSVSLNKYRTIMVPNNSVLMMPSFCIGPVWIQYSRKPMKSFPHCIVETGAKCLKMTNIFSGTWIISGKRNLSWTLRKRVKYVSISVIHSYLIPVIYSYFISHH